VLQAFDYTLGSIVETDRQEWTVHASGGSDGVAAVVNPLRMARDYARHLEAQLKEEQTLIYPDGKHAGQLKFGCGYGTVFSRMTRDDFTRNRLYGTISREFVLGRDEIDPADKSFTADNLIEKIHNMFTVWTHRWHILSMEEIAAVRSLLFPEVRVTAESQHGGTYHDQWLLSRHSGIALDLRQENIAHHLGDKHRLIRGAAGSGKTLVLANRAKVLAKLHPEWNILVLCSGLSLSGYLQQLIEQMMNEPDDLFDLLAMAEGGKLNRGNRVQVYNFRQWLRNVLHTKEEELPALLNKLENKEAILPTYDAILIDEGHNFEQDWLRLLGHVLNPDTQSLLIVEDRSQSIAGRRNSLTQNTGLNFRGRSKILTVNYRNTAQIVRFAWEFYQRHTVMRNGMKLGTARGADLLQPPHTRRTGPEPDVRRFGGLHEEMQYVAERIAALHSERRISYSDMLILYRVKDRYDMSYVDVIRRRLKEDRIPFRLRQLSDETSSGNERAGAAEEGGSEGVAVSSMHDVGGLDYRAVFIVNLESMPYPLEAREEREVTLLYIGMTRALEWLHLTYSGDSKFTKYLDEAAHVRSLSVESRMG
jgi:hypothetical protein